MESCPQELILPGGGMKGVALAGAVQALQDFDALPSVVHGSSVGAIVGAGVAAGMQGEDILTALLDHAAAFRPSVMEAYRIPIWWGEHTWETLARHLRASLGMATFRQAQGNGTSLFLSATDLNHQESVTFSHETHPHMRIADAAAYSALYPGLFIPGTVTMDGKRRLLADGGIMDNIPLHRVEKNNVAWVLLPSDDSSRPAPVRNVAQLLPRLVNCAIQGADNETLCQAKDVVRVRLDTRPIDTMSFDIAPEVARDVFLRAHSTVSRRLGPMAMHHK